MIKIRAHHGMCLFYFQGKGYSADFVSHMANVKKILLEADPLIEIVAQTDEICSSCPNNENGLCTSHEKVLLYDRSVLRFCGLEEGCQMHFSEFMQLVSDRILSPGKRCEICPDCMWNEWC